MVEPLMAHHGVLKVIFDDTDIVDPKIEIGQGPELVDTWRYYVINSEKSYLYQINNPNEYVTIEQRGNPFQIGLGAGNKDINEYSASAWLTWHRNGDSGPGDININLEDACPPEGEIVPILECVSFDPVSNTYIAHFGYQNENEETIIIPIGDKNKFSPDPALIGDNRSHLSQDSIVTFYRWLSAAVSQMQ